MTVESVDVVKISLPQLDQEEQNEIIKDEEDVLLQHVEALHAI